MVVTHCVEPEPLIVDSPQLAQDQKPAAESPFSSDELMIASVDFKSAEDRETQMRWHKAVESKV